MIAQALIERARGLGITLSVAGDRIRYAPKSTAPPDFVGTLREHKAEVLAYLRRSLQEPTPPEMARLLAWATELAEQELDLATPVEYVEAPRRTVTTGRVSWYAARYLTTIATARHHQQHPELCWGLWTPQWWREREEEAIGALAALRQALEVEGHDDQSD